MLQAQEKRIWETPLYADFPRSEYEDRVRRARAYMAERELDAFVMWDPANVRVSRPPQPALGRQQQSKPPP